jgi:hypothetical protein
MFTPFQRKTVLLLHVSSSVGWLGALLVFATHAIAARSATDDVLVRSAALAMQAAAWKVILPLALLALVSGIAQALGGGWGIARHYWVAIKLVLTLLATSVLVAKLGPIDAFAAASMDARNAAPLKDSLLLHAGGGVFVLLVALVLAIFKPAGGPGGGGPMPSWVKAFAVVAVLLVVAVGIALMSGGHGPSAHAP